MTEAEESDVSITDLEQHIYAYFVAGDAQLFSASPRYWPHAELVLILEDKISVATRKFGRGVTAKATTVARQLLDDLIAAGAYSSKTIDFGGTMYRFQPEPYKRFIQAMRASDPRIQEAKSGGVDYWKEKFAALTGA